MRRLTSGKPPVKTTERSAKRPQSFSVQHVIATEAKESEVPSDEVTTSETFEQGDLPCKDTVVLHTNNRSHNINRGSKRVILLAGSARVLYIKEWMRQVTVLLDTGSELSFIDEYLTQELGLPVVGRRLINIFRSAILTPKECDNTTLVRPRRDKTQCARTQQ
ncbi:hypothetical protein RB195_024275 [Necator americanus]|uniref:Peptidase A2 domain-containing protein n=1 Tax=Necator americanus TaxID=51031 RepID=A0ABR1EMM3_NECAM